MFCVLRFFAVTPLLCNEVLLDALRTPHPILDSALPSCFFSFLPAACFFSLHAVSPLHARFIRAYPHAHASSRMPAHLISSFPAYSFLNPSTQHARLAGYIIGISAADLVVFFVTRSVILLRIRLTRGRGKAGQEADADSSGLREANERLEDWEEVGLPGNGVGVAQAQARRREEVEGESDP
ncbi:hypothetical protein FB451DRAFT_1304749 [Mycena latifolia]|nr:hypothetical protein FB451DRAFT_1304749 [Mycena latifolia]